jgi:N-acylneuraminate cytidylyltransferase/CMP-N,N'-diacetyllegionaminic acid synthase
MRILAFIPARGGSKGIPHKNIALLNGKPLIQYTIEAAQESGYIDEIILSSDDAEIIDFARSLGLDVAYRRPPELGQDTTSMIDTVMHALDWLKETTNYVPDSILLLQPTSPLRRVTDIDNAIKKFIESNSPSLISVHEMIEHPYECIKITETGWSFLQKPATHAYRRQDYKDKYYYINGAIYLITLRSLVSNKSFVVEGETDFYIMPQLYGTDVDTPFDLKKCECYLKHE